MYCFWGARSCQNPNTKKKKMCLIIDYGLMRYTNRCFHLAIHLSKNLRCNKWCKPKRLWQWKPLLSFKTRLCPETNWSVESARNISLRALVQIKPYTHISWQSQQINGFYVIRQCLGSYKYQQSFTLGHRQAVWEHRKQRSDPSRDKAAEQQTKV